MLPSQEGLRSPAPLVADGLRNSLHVLRVVPEAVHLAVQNEDRRLVVEVRLHCAASADIPIPCLAALIVALRWDLPFRVLGVREKPSAAAPDPFSVYRPALEGIDFGGLPQPPRDDPPSGENSGREGG